MNDRNLKLTLVGAGGLPRTEEIVAILRALPETTEGSQA
jgi:hypothetical protein